MPERTVPQPESPPPTLARRGSTKSLPMQRVEAENRVKNVQTVGGRIKESFKELKRRMTMQNGTTSNRNDGAISVHSREVPVADSCVAQVSVSGMTIDAREGICEELYSSSDLDVMTWSGEVADSISPESDSPLSRVPDTYQHLLALRHYSMSSLFSAQQQPPSADLETIYSESDNDDDFWDDASSPFLLSHALVKSPSLTLTFSTIGNTTPLLASSKNPVDLQLSAEDSNPVVPKLSESHTLLIDTFSMLMDELSDVSDLSELPLAQVQVKPSLSRMYLDFLSDLLEELPPARPTIQFMPRNTPTTSTSSLFAGLNMEESTSWSKWDASISEDVGFNLSMQSGDSRGEGFRARNSLQFGKSMSFDDEMKEMYRFMCNHRELLN
ncbi:hypothetical protein HDU98_005763 [Podochytrium sp. JEL0797]|nr:hypothetical protein HDU98_005763 [Podochytrium sp. JEL0797]